MPEIPKGALPNYRITEDRGERGVFDEQDRVVHEKTGQDVRWDEPSYHEARNAWVRKNSVDVAAQGLARVSDTLSPADPHERAPNNSEKPSEAAQQLLLAKLQEVQPEIEKLIERLEAVAADADSLPALKSDAYLLIAGLRGQIARCDPGAANGKAAMEPLRESLEQNPDNALAWASYGIAMLNTHLHCPTGFKRGFAERYLFGMMSGVSIKGELNRVMSNLQRFPHDVGCQVVLDNMLQTLSQDPKGEIELSSEQHRLRQIVSDRLAVWESNPAKAQKLAEARKGCAFTVDPSLEIDEAP